jgi:aryl-alcohol dehydrogenase-like predicted oxidoreductase
MENKLILGTVQFGLPYGINNPNVILITEKKVQEILQKALSFGINTIDTAAGYGEAENRIGNFHKNNQVFKVITKFSKCELNWEQSLEISLDKMNLESVDTVMFHSYESFLDNRKSISGIINSAKGRLFKKLGVSVYTNEELLSLKEVEQIEVIQLPFNLLDNDFQRGDVLKELKDSGKEIYTRSCFLQGLFFMDDENLPGNLKGLKSYLRRIKNIAKENNIETGHLALQYVLNKNYIDGVLFGVDSLEQLNQNLQWATQKLQEEIFIEIDKIKVADSGLLNPSLWHIKK